MEPVFVAEFPPPAEKRLKFIEHRPAAPLHFLPQFFQRPDTAVFFFGYINAPVRLDNHLRLCNLFLENSQLRQPPLVIYRKQLSNNQAQSSKFGNNSCLGLTASNRRVRFAEALRAWNRRLQRGPASAASDEPVFDQGQSSKIYIAVLTF